jgi:hypothetical protein
MDRETVLSGLVSGGGGSLLAFALYARSVGRANGAQVRGLASAGSGFLVSAGAARWLQGYAQAGAAVSLVGTGLTMAGIYILVRERADRKQQDRSRPH